MAASKRTGFTRHTQGDARRRQDDSYWLLHEESDRPTNGRPAFDDKIVNGYATFPAQTPIIPARQKIRKNAHARNL
jgi:hypothetical protein